MLENQIWFKGTLIETMYFRYIKGIFSTQNPTIGVEFFSKKIYLPPKDICIKAHIWDTSGSERYRSVSIGHYREAIGALLVFDVTNKETFDNLGYWLK